MNRIAYLGLAALLSLATAGTSHASAVPTPFPDVISTGPQSFTISPFTSSVFNTDSIRLGSDVIDVSVVGNPSLLQDIAALLEFSGDTFKVKYEVQGFGTELDFSDTVTVEVTALLNGSTVLGSPQTFHVTLSDSCTSAGGAVLLDCRSSKLLTAFDSSQPIVIPAGTPISDITFKYVVLQSDESCVAKDGGQSSACNSGGTAIVDTSDLFDPSWSAEISVVAEPSSLALLGLGIAALFGMRRRRSVV